MILRFVTAMLITDAVEAAAWPRPREEVRPVAAEGSTHPRRPAMRVGTKTWSLDRPERPTV